MVQQYLLKLKMVLVWMILLISLLVNGELVVPLQAMFNYLKSLAIINKKKMTSVYIEYLYIYFI